MDTRKAEKCSVPQNILKSNAMWVTLISLCTRPCLIWTKLMRALWHTITNCYNSQLQKRPTPQPLSQPEQTKATAKMTDAHDKLNLKLTSSVRWSSMQVPYQWKDLWQMQSCPSSTRLMPCIGIHMLKVPMQQVRHLDTDCKEAEHI